MASHCRLSAEMSLRWSSKPVSWDPCEATVERLGSRVAVAHHPFPKCFNEETSLVFPPIRNDFRCTNLPPPFALKKFSNSIKCDSILEEINSVLIDV